MTFRFRIGEYIQDMQSDGKINSPSTVRIYVSRLNVLADEVSNRDPRTVGREDVKRTLQRWSPSSKAHARSIFVSFFDWCEQEGHTAGNPARKTHRPKVKPAARYRLTLAETHAVANAAESNREKRAVLLPLFAGLRNQELRGAQGRHFQREGWIWVSPDIAKGGRERWIPVLPELEAVVQNIRATVGLEGYVLPARRWNDRLATVQRDVGTLPCASSTLCALVKRIGTRAGIAADVLPHTLRHAFCDHVQRATNDVRITQALMGHSSITTTQGYTTRPSLDELAAAMGIGYPSENGSDQPIAALVAANDPSHKEAALSDPLFWLGVRLGALQPTIEIYREAFSNGS